MKKTCLILLLQTIYFFCFSQDTIFSDAYPKGIIFDKSTTVVRPNKDIKIDKGEYKIEIDKNEVIKITDGNSIFFQNDEYKSSMNFVVPVDPSNGKICYTEVLEIKGAKKKAIYDALKTLPNTSVTFNLVSKDETEFSSLFYRASFFTKYAGDLHILIFDINIKIKDEKIKYEITNFRLYFSESKQTNFLGNNNYSTLPTHVRNFPLETLYTKAHRERWTEMWGKITANINTAVTTVTTSAKKSKGDW